MQQTDAFDQAEIAQARRKLIAKHGMKKIIGEDRRFCNILRIVQNVAKCDVSVLITGETGTGKELIARAVHHLSSRASKPFVAVNCGAVPTELFENEFFGHVKGAFTGAVVRKEGIVQAAESGSLFLDEIDSISSVAQAKLLRFVEEGEYKSLGENRIRKSDIRIIAASGNALHQKVREGAFREDLFYRLNVISLPLPPLRERRVDIPPLAQHFLEQYASRFSKSIKAFASGVLVVLSRHDWPGNIRELENAVQHAVAVCRGNVITVNDLNLPNDVKAPHLEETGRRKTFKEAKTAAVNCFEKQYLTDLLNEHNGNITHAARSAGKNRRAFWELMRKHHLL